MKKSSDLNYYVSEAFISKLHMLELFCCVADFDIMSMDHYPSGLPNHGDIGLAVISDIYTKSYTSHQIHSNDCEALAAVIGKLFAYEKKFRDNKEQMENACQLLDIIIYGDDHGFLSFKPFE